MPRLKWRLVAALAAGMGLGAAGYAVWTLRPVEVSVAAVERDVAVQVYGLGTIEARQLARIGAEVPGMIEELAADHGDRVAAGDVLARLHRHEQEARVAQAEARVAQARADLERAQAAVDKARTVADQQQRIAERRDSLLRNSTVSVETAEDARAAAAVAQADLALARSQVEVARAAIADVEANLLYEAVVLDHYSIRAPVDAVVIARHKELGAVAMIGEPLFTLADPASIWVLAYVDEAAAGPLHVGQRAEITLRSLPSRTFRGHVARIDLESDRVSEERRVYVAFDERPETLHLGEQAEAVVTVDRLERAILVPEIAIVDRTAGSGTVWMVEEGRLRRRAVELGHRTLDGRWQVLGELPAEAAVVAAPHPGLREGRLASVATVVP